MAEKAQIEVNLGAERYRPYWNVVTENRRKKRVHIKGSINYFIEHSASWEC